MPPRNNYERAMPPAGGRDFEAPPPRDYDYPPKENRKR